MSGNRRTPPRTPPMQPQNLQALFDEVADPPSQTPAAAAQDPVSNEPLTPSGNGVSQDEMVAAFTAFGQHLAQQIHQQLSSLSSTLINGLATMTGQNTPAAGVPAGRTMLSTNTIDPQRRLMSVEEGAGRPLFARQHGGSGGPAMGAPNPQELHPHHEEAQIRYPNPNQQPPGHPMHRPVQASHRQPEVGYPGTYPPSSDANQYRPPGPFGGVGDGGYAPRGQHYPQQRLSGLTRRQPETGFEEEGRDLLERFGQTAFTDEIIFEPTPIYFVAPKMKEYSGRTDPSDHVCSFQDSLTIYTVSDQMRCRLFLMTLRGEARQWFSSLPPQSICGFGQFVSEFLAHFSSSRKPQRTSDVLLSIRQGQIESLRDYIFRFRELLQTVTVLEPAVARSAFKMGLKDGLFKHSLSTMPLHTLEGMMRRAGLYITAEEEKASSNAIAKTMAPESSTTGGRRERPRPGEKKQGGRNNDDRRPHQRPVAVTTDPIDNIGDQFRVPICTIEAAIRSKPFYRRPEPMKAPAAKRNTQVYCEYHDDHGHDTNDCRALKSFLAKLMRGGLLKEFLKREKEKTEMEATAPSANMIEDIPLLIAEEWFVISGGIGPSASHKSSLRAVSREVASVGAVVKTLPITYDDTDLPKVPNPYNDAVVIQMVIHSCNIHRVLVDGGSSVNIMFHHSLPKLKIAESSLKPISGDLVGFSGERKVPEGIVTVPVAVRSTETPQLFALHHLDFVVIRGTSSYNAILGRPFLSEFRAVYSPRHFCVKFPSAGGAIITARGDPVASRRAYLNTIRHDDPEILSPPKEAPKDPQTSGGTSSVQIPGLPEGRTLKISADVQGKHRTKLIHFLQSNLDIFAWLPSELPGVDISVACHRLNIDPIVRPIKQRKRRSADQKQNEIQIEVQKLLDAKFIREIQYPEWISNVVMVPKGNGEWRMCVDFSCLNRYCPKDSYPLPSIEALVDSVSGYAMMSFLDAYSGYHQIKMNPSDQTKTSFITNEGTFCFTVMPFGLRNAGATYQRLMDNVFREQKGRNLEVYVDDILVKSLRLEDHIADLKETFDNLRQYNLKLNPGKCVFGATSGKFLGYMVSAEGIKANPDKIKVIQEMKPPKDISEARRLIGRMAALNRFISRSGEKCAPLFTSLKKSETFLWNEECQRSFELLKKYLTSPPTMTSPKDGEDLYMYLGASETAVSSVLVRSEGATQWPIHYVSKTLNGAEARYSMMEKLVYALVISVRRLRQYFQVHKISIITDRPMRQIIHRPDVSGRLVKWAIELSEFDVEFIPRTSVKAQALADFVADFTSHLEEERGEEAPAEGFWILCTDGAAGNTLSGAGIVLTSPEGLTLYGSIKLMFHPTNNQAEYEAILAGIQLAVGINVQKLLLKADSLLAVNQIKNLYECKDVSLMKYLDLIRSEIAKFSQFRIEHIPREQNQMADLLSRAEGPSAVMIRELRQPSTQADVSPVQTVTADDPESWMNPIKTYLTDGRLPIAPAEARKIRTQAARYFMWEGFLYRKSFTGISMKCVHPLQTRDILEEVHAGSCGSHSAGHILAQKILRHGYYWPTLKKDAITFAKKCLACQLYGKVLRQPSQPLQPIISPWPFATWGMDFVGPFPTSSGQRKYLLVLVDYFTKWIEAIALPKATTEAVIKFLAKDVFSRFGLPLAIITDNGSQFTNAKLRKFCDDNGVTLKFASVAHPQTNGQAEAANKAILTILKKRLMGHRALWADELPAVLWSYRTTPSTVTGETPFTLTFGSEALNPTELMIPTARVKKAMMMEDHNIEEWRQQNDELLRDQLDIIEERRLTALAKVHSQKMKAVRHINQKVRPRAFQPGDLVLRKLEVTGKPEGVGKLAATWEGPLIIKKVSGQGAYQLQTPEGSILPRTWNGDDLKSYQC